MAMLIALVFAGCGSKKTATAQVTKQTTTTSSSDEAQKLREQIELQKLQNELDMLKLEQEKAKAALNAQASLEDGAKMLLIPCMREALEYETGHQMSAQGMSTGKSRQELALKDANRNAIAELMTRFVGVIKNGIEDYTKDTDTRSLTREQEAQLEGLCVAAGERAINKLFKPGCREILKDKYGNYGCYVALYVDADKVLDEIANELEVEKVDVDKAIFRKRLQAELDEQSRKEQEKKQQELDRLKELRGE